MKQRDDQSSPPSEPEEYLPMTEAERAADHLEAELIESAVKTHFAQENATLAAGARASFLSVHHRLMSDIEADISALSPQESEETETPAMLLPSLAAVLDNSGATANVSTRSSPSWFSRLLPGANWRRVGAGVCVVLLAASLGHHIGRISALTEAATASQPLVTTLPATALPVNSLEADYDADLHASAPIEFISDNGQQAESWLSQQTGHAVRLPRLSATHTGQLRLLGASRHALDGLGRGAVARAHYILANGARVTLYQMHAPHLGLVGLREETVNGHTFFVKREGRYRTVVWRSGDDLSAIVSPLATSRALQLAASLRSVQPTDVI